MKPLCKYIIALRMLCFQIVKRNIKITINTYGSNAIVTLRLQTLRVNRFKPSVESD
jgi:hypothetical protein